MASPLRHIEINIGKACNNLCRFCMTAFVQKGDLAFAPPEELKRLLSRYHAEGFLSVGFLGGDVSIYPGIEDVVRHAKDIGFSQVQAITNGMAYDDAAKLAALVDAGLTRINFSIHSHLPEVEDYLTQVPGGLRRKMEAVRHAVALHRAGRLTSGVSFNYVACATNHSTLPESLLFFAKKLGVTDVRVNFVWATYSLGQFFDQVTLKYSDFKPHLLRAVAAARSCGTRLTLDSVPPCVLADSLPASAVAELTGSYDHVDLVEHANLGKKVEWKSLRRDERKYKGLACDSCALSPACDGVWREYVETYGFREFHPVRAPGVPEDHMSRLGPNAGPKWIF